jgi:hypothetical protein
LPPALVENTGGDECGRRDGRDFRRLRPDEDRVNLGSEDYVNEWPKDSAWNLVALGRGHERIS